MRSGDLGGPPPPIGTPSEGGQLKSLEDYPQTILLWRRCHAGTEEEFGNLVLKPKAFLLNSHTKSEQYENLVYL